MLLDDTLVVWGGEFGRTVYCQGRLTADDYGRDHHPRCFTVWLAGGGIKGSLTCGETDYVYYNIAGTRCTFTTCTRRSCDALTPTTPRLTFRFQGRDHRLTEVHGVVVTPILA
jgi:hypothetical protein